jgi:hypothetical protein
MMLLCFLTICSDSVAYGRNKTAGAVHFPQWNRERFNNNVLKFMTEYLQTVYSTSVTFASVYQTYKVC